MEIERLLLWAGHRAGTQQRAEIFIMGPDSDPSFVRGIRINNPIIDPSSPADVHVLTAPVPSTSPDRWFIGAVNEVGWAVAEALADDIRKGSQVGLGHNSTVEYFSVIERDLLVDAISHLTQAENLIAQTKPKEF